MQAFNPIAAEVALPLAWSIVIVAVLLLLRRPRLTAAARTGDDELIDQVVWRYRIALASLVPAALIMIIQHLQLDPTLLTVTLLTSPLAGVFTYRALDGEVEELAHTIIDYVDYVEREQVDNRQSSLDSQEQSGPTDPS